MTFRIALRWGAHEELYRPLPFFTRTSSTRTNNNLYRVRKTRTGTRVTVIVALMESSKLNCACRFPGAVSAGTGFDALLCFRERSYIGGVNQGFRDVIHISTPA